MTMRLRAADGQTVEVKGAADVPIGTPYLSEDTEEMVYRPSPDRVVWGDVLVRLHPPAGHGRSMDGASSERDIGIGRAMDHAVPAPGDGGGGRGAGGGGAAAATVAASRAAAKAGRPRSALDDKTPDDISRELKRRSEILGVHSDYAAGDGDAGAADAVTPEEVEHALEQEEELMPFDFSLIHNDPRFVRLVNKFDPSYFSAEGIKQHAKNFVDVVNLPYVGILVSGYRMLHAKSRLKSLEAVRRGEKRREEDDSLVAMLTAMRSNARTHVATSAADIGLSVVTSVVPVIDWVPGLSTGLASTVGSVGTSVASKTIGVGTKVVIKTAAGTVAGMTTAEESREKVMSNWGVTKAFVSYLGYPATDDVVYSQWEPSRLRLKMLFGARPEADVYNMKPKGHILHAIRTQEEAGAVQLEIPLLLLLFRVYDCWDHSYYERLEGLKKKLSKTFVPGPVEDEDYAQDAKIAMPSLWHSKLRIGLRKHVRLLSKYERSAAVNCLTNHAMKHRGIPKMLGVDKPDLDTVRWLMKTLVQYFVEEGQVWVYLQSDDMRELNSEVKRRGTLQAAESTTSISETSISEDAGSDSSTDSAAPDRKHDEDVVKVVHWGEEDYRDLSTVTRLGDEVQAVVLWEPAEYKKIQMHSTLVQFSTTMLDALAIDLGSAARIRENFRLLDKSRKRFENHFPRRYGVLHWLGWQGEDTTAVEWLLSSMLAENHEICLFQAFDWALSSEAPVLEHCGFERIDPSARGLRSSANSADIEPVLGYSNKPSVPNVEQLIKKERAVQTKLEEERKASEEGKSGATSTSTSSS